MMTTYFLYTKITNEMVTSYNNNRLYCQMYDLLNEFNQKYQNV